MDNPEAVENSEPGPEPSLLPGDCICFCCGKLLSGTSHTDKTDNEVCSVCGASAEKALPASVHPVPRNLPFSNTILLIRHPLFRSGLTLLFLGLLFGLGFSLAGHSLEHPGLQQAGHVFSALFFGSSPLLLIWSTRIYKSLIRLFRFGQNTTGYILKTATRKTLSGSKVHLIQYTYTINQQKYTRYYQIKMPLRPEQGNQIQLLYNEGNPEHALPYPFFIYGLYSLLECPQQTKPHSTTEAC